MVDPLDAGRQAGCHTSNRLCNWRVSRRLRRGYCERRTIRDTVRTVPVSWVGQRGCRHWTTAAGIGLDQTQFLRGHVSIQTTERYLGCKQKQRIAVNDRLGIEPDAA